PQSLHTTVRPRTAQLSEAFVLTFSIRRHQILIKWLLGIDNVVFWTKRELGNVLSAFFSNDQNVMLPVAPGTRFALHDGDHWFHGDHHARFQDGIDIFAQF